MSTDTGWVVQIDPASAINGRVMLDLNSDELSIKVDQAGITWGDTTSTNQESQQGDYGSAIAVRQYPNRTVTIPLFIGAHFDDTLATHEAARSALRQKVGLIKRTGVGVVMRQRAGGPAMYADIVDATITGLVDQYGETGGVETCTLTLECLPDFYGDEVELNTISSDHVHVSQVLTEGTANYLANPNFESGLGIGTWGASSVGWSHVTSGATVTTASPTPAAPVGGPEAMQVAVTASGRGAVTGFGTPPAGDYVFTAYLMSKSGNASVTLAAGNNSTASTETDTAPTGDWQRFACPFTADGINPCFVSITLGGSGTLYVDACQVNLGDEAIDYIDGDSPGGVWSGGAHNSQTFRVATIKGDLPARCRIVVENTGVLDHHGMLWAFQSRNYDPAATAALVIPASSMGLLSGATSTTKSGSINSNVVEYLTTGSGSWTPFLVTTLSSGTQALSHQGAFRVWMRNISGQSPMRLVWGQGSLSVPQANDEVIPGSAEWQLLDLGVVNIEPTTDGSPSEWFGVIQVLDEFAANGTYVDELYFQPLDETAGQLSSVTLPNPTLIQAGGGAVNGAQVTSTGQLVWTLESQGSQGFYESASVAGTQSSSPTNTQVLELTNIENLAGHLGIPSGATISGVAVDFQPSLDATNMKAFLLSTKLIVGGSIAGAERASSQVVSPAGLLTFGGPTDLWGASLTPAICNGTGFGVALQFQIQGIGDYVLTVPVVGVTVYYFVTGFTVAQDAVAYAGQTMEIASDLITRENVSGTINGRVSNQIGDLPRMPPSGLENLPVRLFLRPTDSDFDTLPDQDTVGAVAATPFYRPVYLDRA